ncbi:MAG: hypothetical protein ABSD29_17930 [Verrucomicrobiota bacterium]
MPRSISPRSCTASEGAPDSIGYYRGTINNNLIVNNAGDGIQTYATYDALPVLANNLMWGNGANGINVIGYIDVPILNNIIASNTVGITASGLTGFPSFNFNDVWGNGTNWTGDAVQYENTPGNLSVDPLCMNPAGGDFHLRSQAGRYDPTTSSWVRDNVNSPCIDAGNPASDWVNEPQPNGGRINMGPDGNTPFASKSLPWLKGVMDVVTKNFVLSWSCAPTGTYNVLYSTSPTGPWSDDLPGSQLTAGSNQTTLTYTNIVGGTQTSRFYRILCHTP